MENEVEKAIEAVRIHQYSFCKFISPNDAGDTGAHQGGLYIPKSSAKILFNELGTKGENKERTAVIKWFDGTLADCRFKYYGKGSRNEYRATRLGKNFDVGDFVIIVKDTEGEYLGFNFEKSDTETIGKFLDAFELSKEDTGNLIQQDTLTFKPKAHILVFHGYASSNFF